MHFLTPIRSESGIALIISVFVLCVLTIVGIAATTTTTIDMNIASNERDFVKEFYVADSGWKEAVNWLDNHAFPPQPTNTTGDNVVRNFGDGDADVTNEGFDAGTEDGTIDRTPYWYNVSYASDEIQPGSGKSHRNFAYSARSVADKNQEVEVRLTKVYKVGY